MSLIYYKLISSLTLSVFCLSVIGYYEEYAITFKSTEKLDKRIIGAVGYDFVLILVILLSNILI